MSLAVPAIRERFATDGLEPVGSTPAELAAQMRSDFDTWSQLVRALDLKPQ